MFVTWQPWAACCVCTYSSSVRDSEWRLQRISSHSSFCIHLTRIGRQRGRCENHLETEVAVKDQFTIFAKDFDCMLSRQTGRQMWPRTRPKKPGKLDSGSMPHRLAVSKYTFNFIYPYGDPSRGTYAAIVIPQPFVMRPHLASSLSYSAPFLGQAPGQEQNPTGRQWECGPALVARA